MTFVSNRAYSKVQWCLRPHGLLLLMAEWIFLGRCWQYIVHPPGYLWPVIPFLNLAFAAVFGLAAGLAIYKQFHLGAATAEKVIWGIAAFFLLLHFVNGLANSSWQIANFIEHTAQLSIPFFLLLIAKKAVPAVWFKIVIALTFVGHGLYAANIYALPSHFISMSMSGFGIDEPAARNLLLFAGLADFAAALFIFFPKTEKPALLYMIVWGFLTALARPYTHIYLSDTWPWVSRWIFEFLVRSPHFIIPVLLMLSKRPSKI